jgi:hypothetical protein
LSEQRASESPPSIKCHWKVQRRNHLNAIIRRPGIPAAVYENALFHSGWLADPRESLEHLHSKRRPTSASTLMQKATAMTPGNKRRIPVTDVPAFFPEKCRRIA